MVDSTQRSVRAFRTYISGFLRKRLLSENASTVFAFELSVDGTKQMERKRISACDSRRHPLDGASRTVPELHALEDSSAVTKDMMLPYEFVQAQACVPDEVGELVTMVAVVPFEFSNLFLLRK